MNKDGVVNVIISKQAREELKMTREELSGFVDDISKIDAMFKTMGVKTGSSTQVSQLQAEIDKLKTQLGQLDQVEKDSIKTKGALLKAEAKLANVYKEESVALLKARTQRTQMVGEQRKEIKATTALDAAYQKLRLRRDRQEKILRNLVVLEGKNTKEIRKAQKEFTRLDQKVKKANAATNNFRESVGKYPGTLNRGVFALKNLIAAFGIYSGLQIAREIFNQVKELDSLNRALLKVTGSQELFNQSQIYLKKTAELYGVEINNLTKNYTKFIAGLKGTNLEGAKGVAIFTKLVAVSANLSKSNDELNGILKAVTQSISKGKIQAEELRGQLGDRMEGALNIMARALGVTNAKLEDMLKNGELMADEVLPKFADELVKTFGIDTAERVDTLVASTNRLNNAWVGFIKNIEGGEGRLSKFFIFLIDNLAKVVSGFGILLQSAKQLKEELLQSVGGDIFKAEQQDIRDEAEKTGKTTEEVAKSRLKSTQQIVNSLKAEKKQLEKNLASMKTFDTRKQREDYSKTQKQIEDLERQTRGWLGALEAINSFIPKAPVASGGSGASGGGGGDTNDRPRVSNLEQEEVTVDRLRAEYQGLINVLEFLIDLEPTNQRRVELQEELNLTKKKLKTLDQETGKRKGIVQVYGEQINRVRRLIELAEDPTELARLVKIKKALEDNLKFLKSGEQLPLSNQESVIDGMNRYLDTLKTTKKVEAELEKQRIEGLDKLAEKLEVVNDFQNSFADLGIALVERRIVKLEEESDQIDENFENEMAINDAKAQSEDERLAKQELLEAEQARKKKIIDKKIAKEKEKQAKIDKAAAITTAIIQTAVAGIRSLAETPLPAGAVPFALTLGLGAVQLASIVAQPIPKFKKGTEKPLTKDTLAWIGDGGVTEPITLGDKLIGMSPNTPTLTMLPRGAEVHSSKEALMKKVGGAELLRREAKSASYQPKSRQNADNLNIERTIKKTMSNWRFTNHINNTGVKEAVSEGFSDMNFKNRLM